MAGERVRIIREEMHGGPEALRAMLERMDRERMTWPRIPVVTVELDEGERAAWREAWGDPTGYEHLTDDELRDEHEGTRNSYGCCRGEPEADYVAVHAEVVEREMRRRGLAFERFIADG